MKSIQIFALFILGFLSSCQKDQIEETTPVTSSGAFAPPAPVKRFSERINYANNDYIGVQYNSAGQITRMEQEDGVYTIAYTGSTVHIVDSSTVQNRVVWDFTGQLNAKGFLVSGQAINSRVGTPVSVSYQFTYANNGYLIEKKVDQNSGQHVWLSTFSYKSGNLLRVDVSKDGAYSYGGIYEYGNLADKLKWNTDRFDIINNFTGQSNKNLPVKYTGLDNTGHQSWFSTMTYTMDGDGFPQKMEQVISNGSVWNFEYFY